MMIQRALVVLVAAFAFLASVAAIVQAVTAVLDRRDRRRRPLSERLLHRCLIDLTDLTGTARPIDVPYRVLASRGRAPHPRRTLADISQLYAGSGGRLVILGGSGAGKTVLALELQENLLRQHIAGTSRVLPVRLNMSSWPVGASLSQCVSSSMRDLYQVDEAQSIAALERGELVLILDGLDEMDPSATTSGRAIAAVRLLNDWQMRAHVPAIVTCRSRFYRELAERIDGAREIRLEDLDETEVLAYLETRIATDGAWSEVILDIQQNREGLLARTLRIPWWLNTVTTVCAPSDGRSFRSNFTPLSPATLTSYKTEEELHGEIMSRFLMIKRTQVGWWWRSPESWLTNLARYVEQTRGETSEIDGTVLGGSDVVVHRLWPLVGSRRALNADTALAALMSAPGLYWAGEWSFSTAWELGALFLVALLPYAYMLLRTSRHLSIPPKRVYASRLLTPRASVQAAPPLAILLALTLAEHALLGASIAFALWVALGLTLGMNQALVQPSEANPVDPSSPLSHELAISLACGTAVLPLAALYLSWRYGPGLGCSIAVGYCLSVGLTVASAPWRRYIALLLVSRGRLPWRLRRFLSDAHRAGLLRRAGIAYQFRHAELQRYLAAGSRESTPARPTS